MKHTELHESVFSCVFFMKFFWLSDAGHDGWASLENMYDAGLLYSFSLSADKHPPFRAISTNEFFTIPAKARSSSTTWAGGRPFFTSAGDVKTVRDRMDEHLAAHSNNTAEIKARLDGTDRQAPEYATEKTLWESSSQETKKLQDRRRMLLKDAERMESNRELIEALFER